MSPPSSHVGHDRHPAGVELTHRALIGGLAPMAKRCHVVARHDELVLGLPMAYHHGLNARCWPDVACRCTSASLPCRPGARRHRAASVPAFMGVPATYRLLGEAARPPATTCVRAWMTGADVMPGPLARKFKSHGAGHLPVIGPVGEAAFFEGYWHGRDRRMGWWPSYRRRCCWWARRLARLHPSGLEGPGRGSGRTTSRLRRARWASCRSRVRVFSGYRRRGRRKLTDDGWLHTGDLVLAGPFGLLSFQGRSKNVIKAGGYRCMRCRGRADLDEHPTWSR